LFAKEANRTQLRQPSARMPPGWEALQRMDTSMKPGTTFKKVPCPIPLVEFAGKVSFVNEKRMKVRVRRSVKRGDARAKPQMSPATLAEKQECKKRMSQDAALVSGQQKEEARRPRRAAGRMIQPRRYRPATRFPWATGTDRRPRDRTRGSRSGRA
jgi:hypothetical protein